MMALSVENTVCNLGPALRDRAFEKLFLFFSRRPLVFSSSDPLASYCHLSAISAKNPLNPLPGVSDDQATTEASDRSECCVSVVCMRSPRDVLCLCSIFGIARCVLLPCDFFGVARRQWWYSPVRTTAKLLHQLAVVRVENPDQRPFLGGCREPRPVDVQRHRCGVPAHFEGPVFVNTNIKDNNNTNAIPKSSVL